MESIAETSSRSNPSLCSESKWNNIPAYQSSTSQPTSGIEAYNQQLYEERRKDYSTKHKDEYAEKLLKEYQAKLDRYAQLYTRRYNFLFDSFKREKEDGASQCTIKVEEYGPDTNYDSDECLYLNKAWDDFCLGLNSKNYSHQTSTGRKQVIDFMDGNCTIGYKSLTIKLK